MFKGAFSEPPDSTIFWGGGPLVLFWSLVTAYLKGDMLSLRMALTSDNLALPLIFLNLLR